MHLGLFLFPLFTNHSKDYVISYFSIFCFRICVYLVTVLVSFVPGHNIFSIVSDLCVILMLVQILYKSKWSCLFQTQVKFACNILTLNFILSHPIAYRIIHSIPGVQYIDYNYLQHVVNAVLCFL